eukprot:TRINITY_DN9335_c0_g1_i2.p1 TRINITY_DN9335_c0_g1~~TRINITY_DN9335_c0_g1_i2.p1  ORF type:complete len:548 (+),score=95.61 TRINITY_DN9335_c0_g1_i2:701-2344(+)
MIVVTRREYGTGLVQVFVSLKLQTVSLDAVMWILKSLERDSMTPTERAIQSRFKESFGIKMTTHKWTKLLEAIRNPKLVAKDEKRENYEFDVLEIEDIVSGSKTYSIYPKDYRWIALDMSLKPTDINSSLYKEFTGFLESYFLSEHGMNCIATKSISGGRYGCAQFVKACGTSSLRMCSLGQLSQFVQVAISEGMLKYKGAALAWNFNESKVPSNGKGRGGYKLGLVKRRIVEALTESPEGISFAQLPSCIEPKLPFPLDLRELGFSKLKELLAAMDGQVKTEMRGRNQPFAKLVHRAGKSCGGLEKTFDAARVQKRSDESALSAGSSQQQSMDFNRHIEAIRDCIYGLLLEYPSGIDSSRLTLLVHVRLNIEFNWLLFGCSTLLEFLQNYITPYYKLEFIAINPYDATHFVLRLKTAHVPSYYNAQQFTSQYYPVHYRFETDPKAANGVYRSSFAVGREVFSGSNRSLSIPESTLDTSIASFHTPSVNPAFTQEYSNAFYAKGSVHIFVNCRKMAAAVRCRICVRAQYRCRSGHFRRLPQSNATAP